LSARRPSAEKLTPLGHRRLLLTGALGALLVSVAGCADGPPAERASAALPSRLTEASELTLDTGLRYQRISGFGASSAWTGGDISDEVADQFFSAKLGIGLSLLRVHIAPDGTTAELATAQRAAARGAAIWASPWSPPGEWKTSGTDTNGGALLPEFYQAWADRLAGFAVSMSDAGVPLVALSGQNEPNWSAEWETCVYTPEELVTFVGAYLAPALERDSPATKLLGPETANWTTLQQFADPLLADPAASAALGIVAVHAYGGAPYAYTAPADAGKEFWETEVSYDDSTDLVAALQTARQIQRHLTVAGVNAFHYWWLVSDTTGALMQAGQLLPQAYGLGHYSKFVRPGYVRVDVPATPQAGISSSAYYDPESHRSVLVLVNELNSDVPMSIRVTGVTPLEVTPWVTSAAGSLARGATLPFENPISYVFAAQSVTSLVLSEALGDGEDDAPSDDGAAGAGGANSESAGRSGTDDDVAANGGDSSGGAGSTDLPNPDDGAATKGGGAYLACALSLPERRHGLGVALAAAALLVLRRRRRRELSR
jgi:glucuronoarabinoxylan endo-1,4-beta-xylanase